MGREHLLATAALAIAAGIAGTAPGWVQLFPAEAVKGGSWKGADGRGPYSMPDLAAFMKASCSEITADGKSGKCDLLLDYDHQADEEAAKGLAKPAAGWIKQLQIRDDGIYGQVDWTPRAAAAVAGKEYRFVSPVFWHHKTSLAVLRVERASLTNTPNFNTMKSVASRDVEEESSMDKQLAALLAKIRKTFGLKDEADENACFTAIETAAADQKKIAALAPKLGVKADATPAEFETAIAGRVNLITAVATKLGVKVDATQAEFETAIASRGGASAGGDALIASLQTQVNELKAANAKTAATDDVEAAIAAGKITPALKDWALDYAARDAKGFKEFVDKQPVIVGASAARGTPPAGGNRDTTAEDAEVAKQLGISVEQMKKGA